MLVRCVCGSQTSEWAARCPVCAADLAERPLVQQPVEREQPASRKYTAAEEEPAEHEHLPLLAPAAAGDRATGAPADGHTVRDRSRRGRPGPRRGRATLGVAAALTVTVAAATLIAAGSGGHRAARTPAPPASTPAAAPTPAAVPTPAAGPTQAAGPTPGPAAALPSSLGAAILAYADAPDPLYVTPGRAVDPEVAAVAAAALPGSQAVPAGPGGAVVLGTGTRAGHALYIARAGTVSDLGAADVVVPGTAATVGLGRATGSGEVVRTVAAVRTASTLQLVTGPDVALPGGSYPVAVFADGSVAVRTEANQLVLQLPTTASTMTGPAATTPGPAATITGPSAPTTGPSAAGAFTTGPPLGALGAVLAVNGSSLAWTGASGCSAAGACPLRVTDLSTGRTGTVPPPPGSGGWAVGGAFSPDGATLLAFAAAAAPPGATLSDVVPVFVDARAGTVVRSLPAVTTRLVQGMPVGVAWWTADGRYAVYSGLLGSVRSAAPGGGAVVDLEVPASYSLVVL